MNTETPITIETGIPIPPKSNNGGRKASTIRVTLEALKPGESFMLPKKQGASVRAVASMLGIKIVTRVVDSENVRIWLKPL